VPVRARTADILAAGDHRLPIGNDLQPYTLTRLERVRAEAEAQGAVRDLTFAYTSSAAGVILDGCHRAVIANERAEEFVYGWAVCPTSSVVSQ
jgi:hypothetical protein